MNLDPYLMSFSDAATFEAPALHPNTMQDMQPQKKRARTLREKDWEPCKPRITELLSTQKPQLAEVKLLIEKEFNFTAEDRQWKSRLKQWGLERNIKPKEMKAIVRNRQQRRLIETDKRDLKFRVRGHEVEPQKIERWMKRYDVMESALYAPSPAASTPSAVSYATLSEIGSPGPYGALSPESVQDADMNMDSLSTTSRPEILSFPKTPQNINNPPVTPQQGIVVSQTTPWPFITDREPWIQFKKINDTHFYTKWQYDFSVIGFNRAINFIMLKLSKIPVTDSLKRTFEVMSRYLDDLLLGRNLMHYLTLVHPSTPLGLLFYIRHVPLTALNLMETVNIRIRLPGLSSYDKYPVGDTGFDFVSDGVSHRECRVAWIGPVFNLHGLFGWRTSVVLGNELESFPWPDDNEEMERA